MHELAVALHQHVTILQCLGRHFVAVEERVVLVAEVTRLMRHGDLLGQAGAERVGARDDDAVVDAEFEEGVAERANLREEVLMRNRDLAVLVAALLFIGHLVFDLQGAGARFDHLLGEQVGRLGVAETRIDVGDDRHNMRLEVVDLVLDVLLADRVAFLACLVQLAEQPPSSRASAWRRKV